MSDHPDTTDSIDRKPTARTDAASADNPSVEVDGGSEDEELEVKKEIVEGVGSDTTSTRTRHWLTNDLIAALLQFSLVVIVVGEAMGTVDLDVLPENIRMLYIGVVASAAIWTFGQGVLDTVRA